MKILYHHRTRSTDAQRIHILEIVESLKSLGHEVGIVSLVPTETKQDDATRDAGDASWKKLVLSLPFAYDAVQFGYNFVGFPMIVARLMRGRVDFIYERYSLLNFAGVLAAKLFAKPIILEVNSPMALEQARDRHIAMRGLAQWSERLICNMATRVVVVSSPLRRMMQDFGVRPEKLEVMSNGVRLEHFQPGVASTELRRSLGLEGYVVAGFVGWFRDWHGLELLVEAAARLRASGRKLKLMLIGDGPAMAGLQKLVTEYHLSDSVVFTGPLPHAQVPPYLDLIDIAVQPAANQYCCPMKLLEYMALAKAIVAPRQENVLELLREDEEACLFQPGQIDSLEAALAKLTEDAGARARMGVKAREAILQRGYLWKNNACRIMKLMTDTQPDHTAPHFSASMK